MKPRFLLLTILFIYISLSTDFTVNAAQISTNKSHSNHICSALKAKLKITDMDLENARLTGKTAFDLARERGVGEEELKDFIAKEAVNSIDNIISRGLMPRFLGEKIKNRALLKIRTWDGTL